MKKNKQAIIDMMKLDEELGLYDDTEINRIELVCKDCSDSLENCTCIKSTVDFPKQEIKLEDIFNDDKKENIKKFIDEIKNPSEPNQALKDAAERYKERSYSEEEIRESLLEIVLVNPAHISLLKSGYGQFPDTFELTEKGVDYIVEQFKNK
jgi:hypothetical protein